MKSLFALTLVFTLLLSGISGFEYDLSIAEKLGAYSLASYCSMSGLFNWQCGDSCKRVEPLHFISSFTSEKNNFYIMGYNSKENAIVIAVRGTVPWSATNWLSDISTCKVDYDNCNSCQVHQGFYEAMQTILPSLKSQFIKLRSQFPQSKVYLTGHSLGGAIATLLAPEIAQLNESKPLDAFVTLGSPRVGNEEFSNWFIKNGSFSKMSSRITKNRDPVVQLPAYSFPFSFKHIGNEVFYKSESSSKYDYVMCEKPENSKCSFGMFFATNIGDHQSYFDWNWGIEPLLCQ